MKFSIIVPLLISVFLFQSMGVYAENRYGLGINDDSGFKLKKLLGQHQVGLGLNVSVSESEFNGGFGSAETDRESWQASAFYRYYHVNEGSLRRFFEGEVAYWRTTEERNGISTNEDKSKSITLVGYYGLEYYISPNFSIDGKVGIQYYTYENEGFEVNQFNAFVTGISVNYYW